MKRTLLAVAVVAVFGLVAGYPLGAALADTPMQPASQSAAVQLVSHGCYGGYYGGYSPGYSRSYYGRPYGYGGYYAPYGNYWHRYYSPYRSYHHYGPGVYYRGPRVGFSIGW